MILMPRKIKHRKQQRGQISRIATSGTTLDFGSFGLVSLGRGWISARQIESARRAMTRYIKRGGKIWIRIFPDKPVTAKPPEVGMGGGKGAPDRYVAVVEPGRVLFEMDGITKEIAFSALRLAASKISVKTKIISKEV